MRRFLGVVVAMVLVGCGKPTPVTGRFGEVTSAVVVVNPVINQGSTTTVASGPARSGVRSATVTGNGVSLLRNRFTAGQATVPSSNAVLVDNTGIP